MKIIETRLISFFIDDPIQKALNDLKDEPAKSTKLEREKSIKQDADDLFGSSSFLDKRKSETEAKKAEAARKAREEKQQAEEEAARLAELEVSRGWECDLFFCRRLRRKSRKRRRGRGQLRL